MPGLRAFDVARCPAPFTAKRINANKIGYSARSNARRNRIVTATSDPDVVVVGAGVAGLNCAAKLHKAGVPVVLLEASDGVGGRVRTDKIQTEDGTYLCDRGFQIFLTSYPEAQEALDYGKLDLRPFYAGALVRWNNDFHRVADPFRHPVDGLASLPNPIGSPTDKIKVGLFRMRTLLGSLENLMAAPETTTLQKLKDEGFSTEMIDRFFRPFLGGIFFDRQLNVTSRLFSFVMRMLATGANSLPAGGIGAVADQLASDIPSQQIKLNTKVTSVTSTTDNNNTTPTVSLSDGTTLTPRAVVVAVEGPEASNLLGPLLTDKSPSKNAPGVGTTCVYFTTPKPPIPGNILYLDGDGGDRIVNNACFPSEVSSTYAPAGKTLVSVSTIGTKNELDDVALEKRIRSELSDWFGSSEVNTWKLLKVYRIPFAQPAQAPPTNLDRPVELGGAVYVAGDHRNAATLEGALLSGRKAAEAVLKQLGR